MSALLRLLLLSLVGYLTWQVHAQQTQIRMLSSWTAALQQESRLNEIVIHQCLDAIQEQQGELEYLWEEAGGRPAGLPYETGWEIVPQRQ